MAAITLADIQDVCPDIERVSTIWLAWVNTKIAVDTFDGEDGLTTKLIRIYFAAHFMTLSDTIGGAVSGPVSGETEGGISRTYAVADMSSSALSRTGYGASALQLIRMYSTGAAIADDGTPFTLCGVLGVWS